MLKNTFFLLSIICMTENRELFQYEGVQYALRITTVTTCSAIQPMGNVRNVIIKTYDFQQYVSMTVTISTENFYMDKVDIRLERCMNYDCEYFQKWSFTKVCNVVLMKNQMWSPILEQISPKITCPKLRKGMYQTKNATLNLNRIVQFYPEAAKYQWKVNFTIFNDKGLSIYCLHFEGHLIPYTKYQKKIRNN